MTPDRVDARTASRHPRTGLIIERDNGEGTADKVCPQGNRGENCFPDLAKFKRVYKADDNEFVLLEVGEFLNAK